ncbi:MAG: DUF6352 family protein [Proteobacteria bacterium]|nr:DUF6352 family protein [Pseudomonadota bacterium]
MNGASKTPDFWRSSGFQYLRRDEDGYLAVTDAFLGAYFQRPEVRPVDESCAAERALHRRLRDDPRLAVSEAELAAMQDPDAIENYRIVLEFRDRLIRAGTLEHCYMSLFADQRVPVPPLFVDQLTHVILRNILDDCADPMRPRAGEILFRPQKVTVRDGAILLADNEIVEMRASTGSRAPADLLSSAGVNGPGAGQRQIELDVLSRENKALYWPRSDQFDTVLDITSPRPGLDALCRVLESWIRHFTKIDVSIQAAQSVTDDNWVWHIGLDAEASGILNDLYNGKPVTPDRHERILALFRMTVKGESPFLPTVAGRPIYLGLAMAHDNIVTLKPQNLLVNLPLLPAA